MRPKAGQRRYKARKCLQGRRKRRDFAEILMKFHDLKISQSLLHLATSYSEHPLAKGRMRLVALRYWGSITLMLPKVVCQRSFFTFAVCLPRAAYFLFCLLNLTPGPRLLLGPCVEVLRSGALQHRRLV